jgi:hypothetical protein
LDLLSFTACSCLLSNVDMHTQVHCYICYVESIPLVIN